MDKRLTENYRIVREIGRGGMSVIYEGYQPSLKRKVAIKKFEREGKSDELFQRFFSEALALAKVSHESIVEIYDLIDESDSAYIVMEYIDGVTLSHLIKKVGKLPPEVAGSIALKVANALLHIHELGIVHRDLKPSNIMVTRSGTVKLMDFGIAHNPSFVKPLTRTGMIMGTPNYMSPEQVRGEKVDFRSDIFSFGAVLYEMVLGKKAFDAEAEGKLIEKIIKCDYISPKVYDRRIPGFLVRIINRCLQRKPSRRYKSTRDMVEDIERFLYRYGITNPTRIIADFLSSPEEFMHRMESVHFKLKAREVVNILVLILLIGATIGVLLAFLGKFPSITLRF